MKELFPVAAGELDAPNTELERNVAALILCSAALIFLLFNSYLSIPFLFLYFLFYLKKSCLNTVRHKANLCFLRASNLPPLVASQ